MHDEIVIFERHIAEQGLKRSKKREIILKAFLKARRHVSAEDLWKIVVEDHPEIGYTTVYRTLKLIYSSGLAEKVDFDDGVGRYERKLGREYHAHFICVRCTEHFEVFDQDIERLCKKLARQNRFQPHKHRLEIFGLCRRCG